MRSKTLHRNIAQQRYYFVVVSHTSRQDRSTALIACGFFERSMSARPASSSDLRRCRSVPRETSSFSRRSSCVTGPSASAASTSSSVTRFGRPPFRGAPIKKTFRSGTANASLSPPRCKSSVRALLSACRFLFGVTVHGVEGDWRLRKDGVEFEQHELPAPVIDLCMSLSRKFGLAYAAIDLALVDGEYQFIEVNPTGEWAWLVDAAGLPIDEAIADLLTLT